MRMRALRWEGMLELKSRFDVIQWLEDDGAGERCDGADDHARACFVHRE